MGMVTHLYCSRHPYLLSGGIKPLFLQRIDLKLALYDRRSSLGLFGKHVNIRTGKWTESVSGIGSNSESFFEYLLKMYLLFGEEHWWWAFLDAYESVQKHLRRGDW